MKQLFTKELLAKSIFKWKDLVGKELLIRVGKCPDELGKGEHICVIGMDKTSGQCYVLVNEFKRGEGR